MPSFPPCGKAGGLQILRWQAFAVKYYGFTLAALTLEPSDFCNNGVNNNLSTILEVDPLYPGAWLYHAELTVDWDRHRCSEGINLDTLLWKNP